jgi:small subunit ribosomal protein S27e
MDLIQKPKSSFLKVKCQECEHEMMIFDHAKTKIECQGNKCSAIIAEPLGGKAHINGTIIEKLS